MKPSVGWIGTGVMGKSMAFHLLKAGYPLGVFTRTENRAKELLDSGAHWYDSPRDLARQLQGTNSKPILTQTPTPSNVPRSCALQPNE